MSDYTATVERLERMRLDMAGEIAAVKHRIRAQYKPEIDRKIEEATNEIKYNFARALAEAVAAGVPSSVLREEVLHTGDWKRWTYWRDLAGIEPDRVVRQNARKAAKEAAKPYVIEDGVFYAVRDHKGREIPKVRLMGSSTGVQVDTGDWQTDIEYIKTHFPGESGDFSRFLRKHIEDAGDWDMLVSQTKGDGDD